MRSNYNRRDVEKAWESFTSGDTGGLEKVRPVIRDSWLRSKALGIDPSLSRLPEVVSPARAEESSLHDDLFAIGREVVHRILGILGDPWAAAHFCDREGRALALVLRPRLREKFAELQAVPGVGVGENYIGTGAGTAMLINRPIQIRPGEFYCHGWQDFLTHSIPIHDPVTQEVIGAFAISWSGEHTHPQIVNLLRWGQQTIQRELHERQLLDRVHLLQQYETYGHRFPSDALLAIDREGRIIAANSPAARVLGQTPHALVGRPAVHNLGIKPEELWDAHVQELALFLPQTDRALIAEGLSVERQGRATGGVLVLRSGHEPKKSAPSNQPWHARYTFSDLIGKNPRFHKALEVARIAATTDLSVLLLGESGTGKELFAQAIHRASPRAAHPFVPFNCGGVTEELIGAELFGYVEGAFTGAVRGGRPGSIEVANGGTLFLDEVDAMPVKMQVSLLRVLEDGVVV
ncbi:MAG: sigma-54-dependent Fis family transcriptional regulator, partial [Candidatus Binatia bacterium]